MKVGIIQSNFLPWRGYFDFIREVDLFILYDDMQYTKNDWRNRNRIKTKEGATWITAPVYNTRLNKKIEETKLVEGGRWREKLLGKVHQSYRSAPYFKDYFNELEFFIRQPVETISELNYSLLLWGCEHLDIDTPIKFSRELEVTGEKTERLINILKAVGGDHYLSGPAARHYLQPEMFEQENITLEYKRYNYPEYEQLYPPFEPSLSIIDLFFMHGPDSVRYLTDVS
ncbi:WbqC family protein [Lacimicrobium sp. SS2-24]|uniref:WbqC family protein n=1 Tax=Lacimicrobium sp. SS2-24 TaxID=2005569 RepID=UPI000B4BE870|nr:WbqC family protein [Lacimicrobium sp. SS2-24]